MAAKRKIEVFSAGCATCEEAIAVIRRAACPSCEGTGGYVFDCERCGGEGTIERRLPVPVRIPAGVPEGTVFQVSVDDPAVLSILLTVHIRQL